MDAFFEGSLGGAGGDGFAIAPTFTGIDGFTLQPANGRRSGHLRPDVGGVSSGTLELVDTRVGLVVETVGLIGEGIP